jgi:GrpB-like predicted nucleotidyltransferase (UPF0157 family)
MTDSTGRGEFGLGLSRSETALRGHDERWQEAYRATAVRLRAIVGNLPVAIEHVGSTAVPGLPAKPILDVALNFRNRASLDETVRRLAVAGYEWRGDFGEAGGVIVVEGPEDARIVYLHLVEGDDPQWHKYLRFRDRLRVDTELRSELREPGK